MFLTAFIMGIAGSFHCLGMCSPLAVAVSNLRGPALRNRLLYNSGRIFTYGVLGALVGSFGALLDFTGFQNTISLALGIGLIIIASAGIGHFRIPFLTAGLQKVSLGIKGLFSRFIVEKSIVAFVVMGVLNGLLPCGLTFLALTYCVTLSSGTAGFAFMLVFGAGTLPVMVGMTSLLKSLTHRFNFSVQRFSMITLVILGGLLIARSVFVHHQTRAPVSDSIVICK